LSVVIKLCECGCGQPIPIASVTHRQNGWVKGQQRAARFIRGHSSRVRPKHPSRCEHTPKVAKGLCQKCYTALHQKDHPEQWRTIARRWGHAHPEAVSARTHRRRSRIKGNGGSWTAVEWATLKRQYGFRCVCCLKTETELKALGRKLVPDHIVPVIKGGLNHITNIQPLCHGRGGCNNRKGGKYIDYVIS